MPEHVTLMKVALGPHHLVPGRTRHMIHGGAEFAPFVALEIDRYPDEQACYLFHISGDGRIADTWHMSVEDALHQAEYEFGVQRTEWVEVKQPLP